MNARLPKVLLQGGVSTGRTHGRQLRGRQELPETVAAGLRAWQRRRRGLCEQPALLPDRSRRS